MSYRVRGINSLPLVVQPTVSYRAGTGRGTVRLVVNSKYTQDKPITDVVIHLPLPRSVKTSTLTSTVGTVKQDVVTKVVRWDIGKMRDDKSCVLEGQLTLPLDFVPDESPTVTAEFSIKMYTVSGIKVDGLAIKGVRYKPVKGVRSLTQAGKYQFRC